MSPLDHSFALSLLSIIQVGGSGGCWTTTDWSTATGARRSSDHLDQVVLDPLSGYHPTQAA